MLGWGRFLLQLLLFYTILLFSKQLIAIKSIRCTGVLRGRFMRTLLQWPTAHTQHDGGIDLFFTVEFRQ